MSGGRFSDEPQDENERKQKDIQLRQRWKTLEHEGNGNINCSRRACNTDERLEKDSGGIGYQMKDWDYGALRFGNL